MGQLIQSTNNRDKIQILNGPVWASLNLAMIAGNERSMVALIGRRKPDKYDLLAQKSVDAVSKHLQGQGLVAQGTRNSTIQRYGGDLLIVADSRHWLAEVKADDTEHTDTIFAELWADVRTNESGWLMNCSADMLYYHWHRTDNVVRFSPKRLRHLLFEDNAISKCRIVKQSKNKTSRLTIGVSVPTGMLRDIKGFQEFSMN